MQDKIIAEVGYEYGLTYEQAEEMYKQYWMEYVVKSLAQMEHEIVFVIGLGAYYAKLNSLVKYKKSLEERINNNIGKSSTEKRLKNVEKLIKLIENANSKRNSKRYYG